MSQWSERFRYLSREYSANPGRYSLANVPYAREPLDCASDSNVREVILMWASQTTKTTLLENVLGYFITADPSPILMVQPTVETAQAWSKERFNATVRDTPVLAEVISDPKSRDSGNTIQLKTFPGGSLAIVGSNAPSGLAGRARRVVLLDEVDRFPASAGTEGDPVLLAIRRTESFRNSVIYLTSTPTEKGKSRIEKAYEETDKRMWFVPCKYCGHWQTLKWSQIRWEKDGENHKPETAYYLCERCEAHWTDRDRVGSILHGEWRSTAAFAGKRGYFLSGLYSPFQAKRGFINRLQQMVTEFLEAKHGGREQLKTWTNTFLAETWQEEGEQVEASMLTGRVEEYTPDALPPQVALVCAGADVQKDRIELEWVGAGEHDESWGVEVVKVYGDTEKPDTWKQLGNQLNRKFKRTDGIVLSPVALAIDFHFRPKTVKWWSKTHGTSCRVLPVIGIGSSQPSMTMLKRQQDGLEYHTIATDRAKDILFQRMALDEAGPRYMHFPRGFGYDDDWFRQLTSERKVTRYVHGFPKGVYEKEAGARNEALDMRVYWLACMDILNPQIAAIQANLSKQKPSEKTGPQITRQNPATQIRRGFVNSWRL